MIVGAMVGSVVGGTFGLLNPAIFNDVYPSDWKKTYENNGAILFPTCIYGIIGGAVGGSLSDGFIHDCGVIGGTVGGAVGGTLASVIYIYTFYLDNLSKK
jgi:hypothetical protein